MSEDVITSMDIIATEVTTSQTRSQENLKMTATADLLDRAKALHHLPSDNQLAHWLGWPQGTVANLRTGHRIMGLRLAAEFSNATGISLEEVVKAALADSGYELKIRRTVRKKAA